MQAVLSPFVGRLSDVLDRKYLASVPPLIAFVGSVICAKANSMAMLIGGGVLIGTQLATVSIVNAIPSEVLPLKHRALANGLAFIGGSVGGTSGGLIAGAVTNSNPGGWRGIFWIQAGIHFTTAAGFLLFYWPKRRSDYPRMTARQYIWAIDPVGALLFVCSATLMLLALNWSGGAYAWSDAHVAVPLGLGAGILVLFAIYEWKGRSDGMVAHVFFRGSPNFALSCFAFAVEGWIYFSAVNAITPQMTLNMGWETSAWIISLRQLAFGLTALIASIPIVLYSTRYKDLKWPLVITFTIFLITVICYAFVTPSWGNVQLGLNVLTGIGQAGPLMLLAALIQFTSPHEYLATATGLAFSARAIGGAFGSAVLNAIINGKLSDTWAPQVSEAAVGAGLPEVSLPKLLQALQTGQGFTMITGLTPDVLAAAQHASYWAYARAYRLAWWSIFPFVVVAIVAVACLKGVQGLMTEKVEATVENITLTDIEMKKPIA